MDKGDTKGMTHYDRLGVLIKVDLWADSVDYRGIIIVVDGVSLTIRNNKIDLPTSEVLLSVIPPS